MDDRDLIAELKRATLSQATFEAIESLLSRLATGHTPASALLESAVVKRFIYHSRRLLGADPQKAVVVSLAAVELVSRMGVGVGARTWTRANRRLIRLEANAWKEHALALLKAGEYRAADKASRLARRFFTFYEALGPALVVAKADAEANELKLIHGQIVFHLGEEKKGLALVDEAADYLLVVLDEKKKYVRARTIYATLLMRQDSFDEAMDVFQQAAECAEEAGDKETPAYILGNIAFCAAKLGDFERAQQCVELSLAMLSELGLTSELPRLRASLIEMLRARGRYNEAISELYKVRAEYLTMSLPVVAATFSLDIVELLYVANRDRDVGALCAEMVATFTRVGLKKEAMRALAYLNDLAQRARLQTSHVVHVKRFMQHFSEDETLAFAPLEGPVAS